MPKSVMLLVPVLSASMPFDCDAFAVAAEFIANDVFVVQPVWYGELYYEDHTRFAQGAVTARAAL